ncbi:solute carrier family 35 member G1 [Trichonephila inaurata madagascariensis]|uniref:Solute carrier family 35 member G1 n=1 Tax=Trichonephila inaurata madagascariensis TaxID=2747483 RepID=A0A8X7C5N2_9ARAC|nr:solute carrier family 35 member G1 [Trichonephila inaurata madagascariensis]
MKSRIKSFDLQETASPLNSSEKPKNSRFVLFKGLLLGLFSGIFYSLESVLVKDMKNLHPGQLSMYRFIALLVCSMPQTVQCGENVLGPKKNSVLSFCDVHRFQLSCVCDGGSQSVPQGALQYFSIGHCSSYRIGHSLHSQATLPFNRESDHVQQRHHLWPSGCSAGIMLGTSASEKRKLFITR